MVYNVTVTKVKRLDWPSAVFADTIVHFRFRPEGGKGYQNRWGKVFVMSTDRLWKDDMLNQIKRVIVEKTKTVAADVKILVGQTFKVEV